MKTSIFRKVLSLIPSLLFLNIIFSCSGDRVNPNLVVIPTQLLANTNADAGSMTPNGWYRRSGTSGSYTLEWSQEEAASGSYSLKTSTQIPENTDLSYWGQSYEGEMPVGNDLTLSVKIKAKNLTGTGVSIAIRADNSRYPTTSGSKLITTQDVTPITGTFDWTTFSVKLTLLPSDTKYINVYLQYLPKTTGTVYFDDITLTSNNTSFVGSQLLTNKNIETKSSIQSSISSLPVGWYNLPLASNNYTSRRSDEEAASPMYSLKISATTATSPEYAWWYQQYSGPMPAGKDLILTAKIKGKNLTGQGVYIGIGSYYSPNQATLTQFVSTQNSPITGTFDWTSYSVRLESLIGDAKYVSAYLVFSPNTTGAVYFDDITISHN